MKVHDCFITCCTSDDESPGLFSLHVVGLTMKGLFSLHAVVLTMKVHDCFITCCTSDDESPGLFSLHVVRLAITVKRTVFTHYLL